MAGTEAAAPMRSCISVLFHIRSLRPGTILIVPISTTLGTEAGMTLGIGVITAGTTLGIGVHTITGTTTLGTVAGTTLGTTILGIITAITGLILLMTKGNILRTQAAQCFLPAFLAQGGTAASIRHRAV